MKTYNLYILKDLLNNILAISESKYLMTTFCLEIDFDEIHYIVKKETNKEKINKYLKKYNDLYLFEYDNFVVREKDYRIIKDLIYYEAERIETVISSLQEITDNYTLLPKEQKTLNESIELISKKSKSFESFINVNGIIRDYFNNKDFQKYMEEIYSIYKNKIE